MNTASVGEPGGEEGDGEKETVGEEVDIFSYEGNEEEKIARRRQSRTTYSPSI